MAALFGRHRAEVVPAYLGESAEEARKRVRAVVADSELRLLLGMKDPAAVRVRWVERKEGS